MSNQSAIDLSDKQSEAWHYLEDNETTEILFGGGAGGGKSLLGCVWHIHRRTTYPGTRGLIGRAKISALEESTLITLFNVAEKMGYKSGVDFHYNSQKHIINWSNGSRTILKDLFLYPSDPDFISLGSTEYTDAFIDEGTEIALKAAEIVNTRIRYKLNEYGLIPKTLITCNPGPGWVKEKYVSIDSKPVELKDYQKFVQSLVRDNPDKNFASLYTTQLEKISTDYDKARLLEGDWEATPDVSKPFAHQWRRVRVVKPGIDLYAHESELAVFDPNKQVGIVCDINLDPMAITFWHGWMDGLGGHDHCFDEMEIKNASIPLAIEMITEKYGRWLQAATLGGDRGGNRKSIEHRDNLSIFNQLLRGLRMSDTQLRLSPNPTHVQSKADVNYVLLHHPDFRINPKTCPNTCRDMRNVQCDAWGQIMKANRNDINQRADFLDTVRYRVAEHHRKFIDKKY